MDTELLKKVFFLYDKEGIGMIRTEDIEAVTQLMGENPTKFEVERIKS